MSGRGRPRDPIVDELAELYPEVSRSTLFRWRDRLLERAAELEGASTEARLAFIREMMIPKAA